MTSLALSSSAFIRCALVTFFGAAGFGDGVTVGFALSSFFADGLLAGFADLAFAAGFVFAMKLHSYSETKKGGRTNEAESETLALRLTRRDRPKSVAGMFRHPTACRLRLFPAGERGILFDVLRHCRRASSRATAFTNSLSYAFANHPAF
jgi:hypothetical protein